jgi:hypothetical protein
MWLPLLLGWFEGALRQAETPAAIYKPLPHGCGLVL